MESSSDAVIGDAAAPSQQRLLVILCLHGFRQNAKQFRGRLRALQKRLSNIARFEFIDAPHCLPLWFKGPNNCLPITRQIVQQSVPPQQQQQLSMPNATRTEQPALQRQEQQVLRRQSSAEQQQQQQQQGRPSGPTLNIRAFHRQHWQQQQQWQQQPSTVAAPKQAWLVSKELLAAQPQLHVMFGIMQQQQQLLGQYQLSRQSGAEGPQQHSNGSQQQMAPEHIWQSQLLIGQQPAVAGALVQPAWQAAPVDVVTNDQYSTQSEGWDESWQVLQEALSGYQQVDGLLGFSQGGGVVAAIAALLQQQQQQPKPPQDQPDAIEQSSAGGCGSAVCDTAVYSKNCCTGPISQRAPVNLKFVIVASGYVPPNAALQQVLQQQRPIQVPSLHIYAASQTGSDRQVQQQLSEELFELFAPDTKQRLVHDAGHLIPSNRTTVAQIISFLQTFVQP